MSKKRGFTLVEILVVVAITTLVLAMVGGLLIFMAETSGKLIHKSEELTQTQAIEKYLRGVLKDQNAQSLINSIKLTDETISYDEKVIFKDTGLKSFEIYFSNDEISYSTKVDSFTKDCFVRCKLIYKENNHTYDFIIGTYKVTQTTEVE